MDQKHNRKVGKDKPDYSPKDIKMVLSVKKDV
jgi:hypothetical protein